MSMNYWHMQLRFAEIREDQEKEILTQTALIGLGEKDKVPTKSKQSQIDRFKENMKIGDVVLVRNGGRPIALVEVVGEYEYSESVNKELDWFLHRRKVKILSFINENAAAFPQPQGTLQQLKNQNTKSWQYINQLFQSNKLS